MNIFRFVKYVALGIGHRVKQRFCSTLTRAVAGIIAAGAGALTLFLATVPPVHKARVVVGGIFVVLPFLIAAVFVRVYQRQTSYETLGQFIQGTTGSIWFAAWVIATSIGPWTMTLPTTFMSLPPDKTVAEHTMASIPVMVIFSGIILLFSYVIIFAAHKTFHFVADFLRHYYEIGKAVAEGEMS